MQRTFWMLTLLVLLAPLSLAAQGWQYHEATDPFTDADRSYIFTLDVEEGTGSIGLKCLESGPVFAVMWGSYYGGDFNDRVRVLWRVDDNPSHGPLRWGIASNTQNRSALAPNDQLPTLLKEMKAGLSVIFRVTDPMDGESQDVEFSLVGLTDALEKLSCAP